MREWKAVTKLCSDKVKYKLLKCYNISMTYYPNSQISINKYKEIIMILFLK